MSGDRVFLDTNVLVYAHDASAGVKRDRASALIRNLWDSGDGCLSIQVLQEFFVAVTRMVPRPLAIDEAAGLVSQLSQWNVHSPGADDVLGAIELHGRTAVSFWDAMIIRSASKLGCGRLYSEDLGDRQHYDGVEVRNPFSE
jgi:predicted nucleic acid-binding protein